MQLSELTTLQKREIKKEFEWLDIHSNNLKSQLEYSERLAKLYNKYGRAVDEHTESTKTPIFDIDVSTLVTTTPSNEKIDMKRFIFNICWDCGQKYIGRRCPFCQAFRKKKQGKP